MLSVCPTFLANQERKTFRNVYFLICEDSIILITFPYLLQSKIYVLLTMELSTNVELYLMYVLLTITNKIIGHKHLHHCFIYMKSIYSIIISKIIQDCHSLTMTRTC